MEILDLSVYEEKTVELKLPDKRVLNLKKPTQRMYIKFLDYSNKLNTTQMKAEEIFNEINTITHLILNNNNNGVVVDIEDVKKMSIDMKNAIIDYYSKFSNELLDQKN